MCIALSCPLGHCVSCLDLNKCRDAALSILFAASSVVFPNDRSQSRIPQGFSQVVFELSVFSQANREGIPPHHLHLVQASRDVHDQTRHAVCRPFALVLGPGFLPDVPPMPQPHLHICGHRDRLITCSLH